MEGLGILGEHGDLKSRMEFYKNLSDNCIFRSYSQYYYSYLEFYYYFEVGFFFC